MHGQTQPNPITPLNYVHLFGFEVKTDNQNSRWPSFLSCLIFFRFYNWPFFFFFFETEVQQANTKAHKGVHHLGSFHQVERKFHSQDSNRQPLPWNLGISPPSSNSLRSSRTIRLTSWWRGKVVWYFFFPLSWWDIYPYHNSKRNKEASIIRRSWRFVPSGLLLKFSTATMLCGIKKHNEKWVKWPEIMANIRAKCGWHPTSAARLLHNKGSLPPDNWTVTHASIYPFLKPYTTPHHKAPHRSIGTPLKLFHWAHRGRMLLYIWYTGEAYYIMQS